MPDASTELDAEFFAQTYDERVHDWPGEMAFYRQLANKVNTEGGSVLEIGCGTGRIAIRLAETGTRVVGLDVSPQMLEVARGKSVELPNVHWVQADMRDFNLAERFGLVIIAGHAFQHLTTAQDQCACLESIKRHLVLGGRLVIHLDHQDVEWLGSLRGDKGDVFEPCGELRHPATGRPVRISRAWSFLPSSQTAVTRARWEELDSEGNIVGSGVTAPMRLHCVFRFEMEHLLARVGFAIAGVYGDFYYNSLEDASQSMIWVARA